MNAGNGRARSWSEKSLSSLSVAGASWHTRVGWNAWTLLDQNAGSNLNHGPGKTKSGPVKGEGTGPERLLSTFKGHRDESAGNENSKVGKERSHPGSYRGRLPEWDRCLTDWVDHQGDQAFLRRITPISAMPRKPRPAAAGTGTTGVLSST